MIERTALREGDAAWINHVCGILSNPTNRHILTEIADHNPRTATEFEPSDLKPAGTHLRQFRTNLHHQHIPKLVEAGLIDWESESHTITRGPNFEAARPVIEVIDRLEA